jgi:hypothetical protein
MDNTLVIGAGAAGLAAGRTWRITPAAIARHTR